ncbi:MAG: tripartite tricarboxylate transporter substrate binding protein [Betaproteobacteria bacterium]|nr:tripartite tricarboxylate transporter substrate binding protein [Betaproteobacteria bacterium]MBI2292829.1 tripartite tricarboxylate transporter substrate binding protein [Betaproteobacteria bacterium]
MNRLLITALKWLGATGAVLTLTGPISVLAQSYPERPLRFLVPYGPGGPTDTMARVVGQQLSEHWGRPVVIENRPGATGNIGTGLVARATADGYTILVHTSAFAVNPSLFRNAGYDPIRDFAPVIVAGITPNMLFAHPSVAVHTLAELIALAKAKPLSYASPGAGTTPHLTAELLLKTMYGVDIAHIPYTSGGIAVNAVVSGQVPIGSLAIPSVVPFVKAGRLRGIVVTSAQRVAQMPDVPTVAESGHPGYEDYTWIAFLAPRATPRAIVEKLNAEISKALKEPAAHQRLGPLGFDHSPNTPAQFADYLKREVVKWAKVVKDSGARAD